MPTFAVVAAFEMKKVRQRGIFKIDLNKFTTDSLTLRFDENIGDLSPLRADSRHFREINLDDPLYRQREINVMVDGLNAQDFGQYINFVTVQMRKKHGAGEESFDEVPHRSHELQPGRQSLRPALRLEGRQRSPQVDGIRIPPGVELLRRRAGGGRVDEDDGSVAEHGAAVPEADGGSAGGAGSGAAAGHPRRSPCACSTRSPASRSRRR